MPHVDASELPHDGNAKWFVSLYGNCCLLFSSGLVLVWVLFFGCRLFSSADKQLYLDFGFLGKRIFIHGSGSFFQIFSSEFLGSKWLTAIILLKLVNQLILNERK